MRDEVIPTFTQIPNVILDKWLSVLTGAELKIMMYLCRRTYGFRKYSDAISISQFATGIKTRDGRVLDTGTGLTKKTVWTAVTSLEARRLVVKTATTKDDGGCGPNVYKLNVANWPDPPPSKNATHRKNDIGVSTLSTPTKDSSTAQSPTGTHLPISPSFTSPTHQHVVDTTACTEEGAMCNDDNNWASDEEEEQDYLAWVREREAEGLAYDTDCEEEGLVGGSSENTFSPETAPASRTLSQTDAFYDGGPFMEDEEGLKHESDFWDAGYRAGLWGTSHAFPEGEFVGHNADAYRDGYTIGQKRRNSSSQAKEVKQEPSSTSSVVDTTTNGRLVVGEAATAETEMPAAASTSPNLPRNVAGDTNPLPSPEIAAQLAPYEAWADDKIYAHCLSQYKWDTAWIEALRYYYGKAKANPLRYVRDMCLRRIAQTLELEAKGLKDEKPRELKLHHDRTNYADPERLRLIEEEKKRQQELDARAEARAKELFANRRRRAGNEPV